MFKHAMPHKYSSRHTTAHNIPIMYLYGAQPASYEITKFAYSIERFNEETISYTHVTQHTNVYGKAIPLQAWAGPEGSRRLRLPDFKTIGT